ncbi:polypyrimidine tract-binding protein homolog 2 isoform X1 [Tanacetum coccineum]
MEYQSTLKSSLARVKNNDGKVLGKDGKPMTVLRKVQFEVVGSTPNTDSNDGLKKVNDVEAQSIRVTSDAAGSSPIISMTPMDSNGDGTNRILNQQDGVGNIAAMSSDNTKPTSFASMLKDQSGKHVVHLKMVSNNVIIPGADVAIPIEVVDVISNRFNNTRYGYFIRKRIAFPCFLPKLEWNRLNIWGANTRLKKEDIKEALVWVKIHKVPIVAYSEIGLSLITSKLGHPIMLDAYTSSMCLKSWGCNTYVRALVEVSTDKALVESLVVAIPYQNEKGYSMETVEIEYEWRPSRCDNCKIFDHKDNDCPKKLKEVTPTPAKDDGFVQVTRKKDKIFYVNDTPWNEATSVNDDLIDDDDDVEEVFMEHVPSSHGLNGNANKKRASTPNIESHVGKSSLAKLCHKVFRKWKWTSNGVVCLKGSRIILGWNPDIVDVVVILFDERSAGTSNVDTALRDFQECVEDIEVSDVNCSGANAVFQPYRISDHSPAILRIHVRGFWMYKVVKRLKLLKKPLRKLLYNQGNIFETVKHLRHELDEVQYASLIEERFLQQKAKVEWLHLGDANTAYFYKVVKSQVSRNRINSVMTKNGVCVDGDQVPMLFIDHYTEFLGQQGVTFPFNSNDLFCTQSSSDVAFHMVHAVTDREIHDAIFSIGDDKSLGPDGYSAAFFKDAWNIIEHDVIKVVHEFFTNCILLKELNYTIIALIPKISTPLKISISVYLLLKPFAFVDIQKAYDTVDWDFLKAALIGFGFDSRMIGWIMKCVTSTIFSLSINGTLHGYFKGKRGLCYGDPMSPYLFTLVMEVLTLMLHRRVCDSENFTYHRYYSKLNIINLCFADDLFLFAHGDVSSTRVIVDTLDEFKNAFGLTPSLPKSTAYFYNVLNYVKIDILSILPFEEGKLPVKYLGVPLVPSRLIYRDFSELVEKVRKRINDWKNKSLSLAGRVQLIRSVLSSMHVYWASVFILPSRLMLDLE